MDSGQTSLDDQAVAELQQEAKRGAARAELVGALGWKKPTGMKLNKIFLHNTILSTVRGPGVKKRINPLDEVAVPSESQQSQYYQRKVVSGDIPHQKLPSTNKKHEPGHSEKLQKSTIQQSPVSAATKLLNRAQRLRKEKSKNNCRPGT
ncbi:uncharacterized protein LOC106464162 [Limulus polyphemus]|uniref:Uncharacterized protein LOC106464162 n=1 Tax=Limulus polyphemus TaxID=6850 RepID=A0ABM1BDE9_LIMPO|nr:uncharacterized protein LOC106464162 [Limulus polyphemus]